MARISTLLAVLVVLSGCGGDSTTAPEPVPTKKIAAACERRAEVLSGPNDAIVSALHTEDEKQIGAAYVNYSKVYRAETRKLRRLLSEDPRTNRLLTAYEKLAVIYREYGKALRRGNEGAADLARGRKQNWTDKRIAAARALGIESCEV